jgi:hypothetical protein
LLELVWVGFWNRGRAWQAQCLALFAVFLIHSYLLVKWMELPDYPAVSTITFTQEVWGFLCAIERNRWMRQKRYSASTG